MRLADQAVTGAKKTSAASGVVLKPTGTSQGSKLTMAKTST
jgi:hypothetical protein